VVNPRVGEEARPPKPITESTESNHEWK